MPREERYFDMFARHADVVVRGAEELRLMLDGGPHVGRHHDNVLRAEDDADAITREVVQAVRRTFVTPFDRGDIQGLIGHMDDTIDQMKKCAKAAMLFRLSSFEPDLAGLGDLIVRSARLLREVVPLLERMSPNAGRINALCEQIRQVESEADALHDSAVTALYEKCLPDDALRFIAEREILDYLERVVDRFDDAAAAIETIVVEHI